jgi:hypothetical protein
VRFAASPKRKALDDVDALAFSGFELAGVLRVDVITPLAISTRNSRRRLIGAAEVCFSGLLENKILSFVPNRSAAGGWCGAGRLPPLLWHGMLGP